MCGNARNEPVQSSKVAAAYIAALFKTLLSRAFTFLKLFSGTLDKERVRLDIVF